MSQPPRCAGADTAQPLPEVPAPLDSEGGEEPGSVTLPPPGAESGKSGAQVLTLPG